MIELLEEPCPELLLWGLSRDDYMMIRCFLLDNPSSCGEGAQQYKQFADMLNDYGVPPLDGEDHWTIFNLDRIRSTMIRHARRVERKAACTKMIGDFFSALEEQYKDDDAIVDSVSSDADPVEKWDNEEVAAQVMAELLDGRPVKRDTQRGPNSSGIHDHDIHLIDDRVAALEVTQEVDAESRRQEHYLQKHDLKVENLRHSWSVELDHRCDARPAFQCLPSILTRLEEFEIQNLNVRSQYEVPFIQKLRKLGIRSLRENDEAGGLGKVYIVPHPGSGHRAHPDALTSIVDLALLRKAPKLRRAVADERHLWIWVDYTRAVFDVPAIRAARDLPSTLPSMSDGSPGADVDMVWVAVAISPITAILKCDGEEWSVVELPERAQHTVTDAIRRSIPR